MFLFLKVECFSFVLTYWCLNWFQSCLLLTYSPKDPKIFGFTKDPSSETKPSRQVSVKRNVRMSSSLQTSDLCSQLFCVRPRLTADLNALVNQETTSSIRQLGGIGAFIYLFAKVCWAVIRVSLANGNSTVVQWIPILHLLLAVGVLLDCVFGNHCPGATRIFFWFSFLT